MAEHCIIIWHSFRTSSYISNHVQMHAFDGAEQNVDCRLVYTNKVTILHFWKLTLDEELWAVSWDQLRKQGAREYSDYIFRVTVGS
jgi:hypothetical protein